MAGEHPRARDGMAISPREVSLPERHPLLTACWAAAGIGVLALVAAFALGGLREGAEGARFWGGYWTAWLYWVTLAVGGLFFVLLQHVTRAGWSVAVRRLAEHWAATLPLFALLAVPAVFGAGQLFPWMGAEAAGDPLLAGKLAFLNPGGFTLRSAVYLAVWGGLAWWLRRTSIRQDASGDPGGFYLRSAVYLAVWGGLAWWLRRTSIRQDASGDPGLTRRLQAVSAPGLVAFAVTLTLAAFDWVMALDPHWYSTIFGVYVFAGSTMGILALLALLGIALERRGPLAGVVTAEHYHDLGKLLFAFVVFWAYIGFSQFMLIWYANMPEETIWYRHRLEHGWERVTVALVLGHFVLPFFFLLSRDVKRRRGTLAAAALWLLAMHYVDLYWLVMPAVSESFRPHWLDLVTLVGVGGLALGAFGWLVRRPALVPVADPRLPESLSFENM